MKLEQFIHQKNNVFRCIFRAEYLLVEFVFRYVDVPFTENL